MLRKFSKILPEFTFFAQKMYEIRKFFLLFMAGGAKKKRPQQGALNKDRSTRPALSKGRSTR
jgi:hypothetical protein